LRAGAGDVSGTSGIEMTAADSGGRVN
jgi:hypothetical protein